MNIGELKRALEVAQRPKPTHHDIGTHYDTACSGCDRWTAAIDSWKRDREKLIPLMETALQELIDIKELMLAVEPIVRQVTMQNWQTFGDHNVDPKYMNEYKVLDNKLVWKDVVQVVNGYHT